MILPEEIQQFAGAEDPVDRSGNSPAKVYETQKGYLIKCDEPGEQ